ncbi:MAG: polysaccharide deacetylase family protein [Nitrospiraceae bacterium]|nr:polysaccharide deacetylase family protein [Nitrospiraceae bacterium]
MRESRTAERGARIALYHSIPRADALNFERQMVFLKRNYDIVPLPELIKAIESRNRGSRPLLAVTFDECFRDAYANAVPALLRHGIPATFFAVCDFTDASKHGLQAVEAFCRERMYTRLVQPGMSWKQLRELKRQGFDIGSHTNSHAWCSKLADEELHLELNGSRDRLSEELGCQIEHFAFPFGTERHVSEKAVAMARAAGYRSACWARRGWNTFRTDPYHLRRDPLSPAWPLSVIEGMLCGLFDWWKPAVV